LWIRLNDVTKFIRNIIYIFVEELGRKLYETHRSRSRTGRFEHCR